MTLVPVCTGSPSQIREPDSGQGWREESAPLTWPDSANFKEALNR